MLQLSVPFEIDRIDGRAYVSLVAFRMVDTRAVLLGRDVPFRLPVMNHEFLNLRTYVRHRGEPGIYFLAEWVPSRISVLLGPRTYGLPYRLGNLRYSFAGGSRRFSLDVEDDRGRFRCEGEIGSGPAFPSVAGSVDEFLVERYTAFTVRGQTRRLFRINHQPWSLVPVRARITDSSLFGSLGVNGGRPHVSLEPTILPVLTT